MTPDCFAIETGYKKLMRLSITGYVIVFFLFAECLRLIHSNHCPLFEKACQLI